MGLWGSIRAYNEPLLPQRDPFYYCTDLWTAYGGISEFLRAREVGKEGLIFSEGKHREFHKAMYCLACAKGFKERKHADKKGPYGEFGDLYLEITEDMLFILWSKLLEDFKAELDRGSSSDGYDPWEFNHHANLLREDYGRTWQLVNYELPACCKIKNALDKGQVVYYSSSI